jgi:hypothetical protein
MTRALGWGKHQNPENEYLYKLPETTLRKLAEDVRSPSQSYRGFEELNHSVNNKGLRPGIALRLNPQNLAVDFGGS